VERAVEEMLNRAAVTTIERGPLVVFAMMIAKSPLPSQDFCSVLRIALTMGLSRLLSMHSWHVLVLTLATILT
jgi:hypothetical protein